MENDAQPLTVNIKIPFPTKREAEIAYNVLRVDAEPKRSLVKRTLEQEENLLIATFAGDQSKNVRVALTAFFDCVILSCETMRDFGPPAKKYEYY